MNCNEFRNAIDGIENLQVLPEHMQAHLDTCSSCAEYLETLKQIHQELKPKLNIMAPSDLKQSIIEQVNNRSKVHKTKHLGLKRKTIKRVVQMAAVIVLAISTSFLIVNNTLFNNSAKAAEHLLSHSIQMMNNIQSLYIKFKVRSLEQDNFEHIGTEYDFVEHTLIKEFSKPERWKLSKAEREVAFNGKENFLFIKSIGYAVKTEKPRNFVDWMQRLMSPKTIIAKELEALKTCSTCKFTVTTTKDEIQLVIASKAKGNFDNPYLKNTSFTTSDSKTVYSFSKKDTSLLDIKFYIVEKKKETLILDVSTINYNHYYTDNDFEIQLPERVSWAELTEPSQNPTLKRMTSEEAVHQFFESASQNDWKAVEALFPLLSQMSPDKQIQFKSLLGGLELIKVGKAFKSGDYPGEFVPYEIKLKNGEIKADNMALRKDNPEQVWQFDGGL